MSKEKKSKKKEDASEKNRKATDLKPVTPEKEEGEQPFDFGGLPARDLKKNLGCG